MRNCRTHWSLIVNGEAILSLCHNSQDFTKSVTRLLCLIVPANIQTDIKVLHRLSKERFITPTNQPTSRDGNLVIILQFSLNVLRPLLLDRSCRCLLLIFHAHRLVVWTLWQWFLLPLLLPRFDTLFIVVIWIIRISTIIEVTVRFFLHCCLLIRTILPD